MNIIIEHPLWTLGISGVLILNAYRIWRLRHLPPLATVHELFPAGVA